MSNRFESSPPEASPPPSEESKSASSEAPKPADIEKDKFPTELLTKKDTKEISDQLKVLLESKEPSQHYEAAKLLAYLKDAGITLTNKKGREKVKKVLKASIGHFLDEASPVEHATFLGNLVYADLLDRREVDLFNAGKISDAIKTEKDPSKLSRLLIWEKYLLEDHMVYRPEDRKSIDPEKIALIKNDALTKLENKQIAAASVAFARLSELGVYPDQELGFEKYFSFVDSLDKQREHLLQHGKYEAYTALTRTRLSIGLDVNIGKNSSTEQALTQHATTLRKEKKWQAFVPYVANLGKILDVKLVKNNFFAHDSMDDFLSFLGNPSFDGSADEAGKLSFTPSPSMRQELSSPAKPLAQASSARPESTSSQPTFGPGMGGYPAFVYPTVQKPDNRPSPTPKPSLWNRFWGRFKASPKVDQWPTGQLSEWKEEDVNKLRTALQNSELRIGGYSLYSAVSIAQRAQVRYEDWLEGFVAPSLIRKGFPVDVAWKLVERDNPPY